MSSDTVFLVRLGNALGGHGGQVVGINQIVWDPATNTLHAESDELLDQHTRDLLVVTTGVKDADGHPIGREAFRRLPRRPLPSTRRRVSTRCHLAAMP